jgi:glutaminyl-tRNA synthetase
VKATVHWVSAAHALDAEVRLYNRMYTRPDPLADRDADFRSFLNPDSLEVLSGAKVEPSLAVAAPGAGFQFERQGYFCVDSVDSRPDRLVFNRTVTLRDTWAKIERLRG